MGRPVWLALPIGVAAVLGVVSLALFLRPIGPADPETLRVAGVTVAEPWCNDAGTLCVTRESLEQGFALFTLEPHVYFREKGCRAAWRPDFDLTSVGSHGRGAFRSPCSGATFDRLGLRLFGPSPRALDRYPTRGTADDFEVDLTALQPGPVDTHR